MLDVFLKQAVAVIRLNRVERRNAIGIEMLDKLNSALDQIQTDSTLRVVVIEGASPGFCAGSDLKELAGMDIRLLGAHEARVATACRRLTSFPKPIIAAVEGFAIGGGFLLAAATDMVVSACSARWHLPEVALGWIPPWGLPALVRRVGLSKAKLLAWGADPIDGNEAHRLGLADFLSDSGQAAACAHAFAERLAALPAQAVHDTKLFFNSIGRQGDAQSLDDLATTLFQSNCRSDAAIASLNRFTEKAGSKA